MARNESASASISISPSLSNNTVKSTQVPNSLNILKGRFLCALRKQNSTTTSPTRANLSSTSAGESTSSASSSNAATGVLEKSGNTTDVTTTDISSSSSTNKQSPSSVPQDKLVEPQVTVLVLPDSKRESSPSSSTANSGTSKSVSSNATSKGQASTPTPTPAPTSKTNPDIITKPQPAHLKSTKPAAAQPSTQLPPQPSANKSSFTQPQKTNRSVPALSSKPSKPPRERGCLVPKWWTPPDNRWFRARRRRAAEKKRRKAAAEFVPGATGLTNAQRYHPTKNRGPMMNGYAAAAAKAMDTGKRPAENISLEESTSANAEAARIVKARAELEVSMVREQAMLRARRERLTGIERGAIASAMGMGMNLVPRRNGLEADFSMRGGNGVVFPSNAIMPGPSSSNNGRSVCMPTSSALTGPSSSRNQHVSISALILNRAVDAGNIFGGTRLDDSSSVRVQLAPMEWYVRPRNPYETDIEFWECVRSDLEWTRKQAGVKWERWLRAEEKKRGSGGRGGEKREMLDTVQEEEDEEILYFERRWSL